MTENYHERIPNDILQESRKLAHDLLKNPEIAEKAISDRNIIIKSLKADIEHRKVAFKEIASRYDELSDKNTILEIGDKNCIDELGLLRAENKKLKEELFVEKSYNQNSFFIRTEKVIDKIPGTFGSVLRFLFTGPIGNFTVLALFSLLFIASFTGWGFVAIVLEPLVKLIHGGG